MYCVPFNIKILVVVVMYVYIKEIKKAFVANTSAIIFANVGYVSLFGSLLFYFSTIYSLVLITITCKKELCASEAGLNMVFLFVLLKNATVTYINVEVYIPDKIM